MKTPYLVQRGEIKKPLLQGGNRLTHAVNMDYMGSSEFEYGALPRSLRALQAGVLQKHLIPDITQGEHQLRVISLFDDQQMVEYTEYLKAMRAGQLHLKESSRFEADRQPSRFSVTDFWWDVENHVMWSFHKVAMNRLPEWLQSSWKYMDEQKALRDAAKV